MTTHPIDAERIKFLAAYLNSDAAPLAASELAERVGPLLDALAAAEHRATRAEAQSAIRGRAVAIHRQRAREAEVERDREREWRLTLDAAHDEEIENAEQAEARIKAVRDIHTPEKHSSRDGDGAICQECLYGDGYSVKYPCPTIRALDGDA